MVSLLDFDTNPMRRLLAVALLAIVLLAGVYLFLFRGSGSVDTLSPAAFVAEHEQDALILDVRTQSEYDSGHLEGAVNINVFASDFRERVEVYNRDRPAYLYCGSGQRSGGCQQRQEVQCAHSDEKERRPH